MSGDTGTGERGPEPIARRPVDLAELPLSPLQQRIWYLCTSYPGDASPIIYLAWRIHGPLDAAAWARAVSAVVDRHESLRTRFVPTEHGPVQVFGPPVGLAQERFDLTGLPPDSREAAAQQLLKRQRIRVLVDLEKGPLVGSCLIALGAQDHVWCFTVHHILADGASLAIVEREVLEHYRASLAGHPPRLVDAPIQYGDFALWQDRAAGDDEDLRYWLRRLAGVPPLELPTDAPRPAEKGTRATAVFERIDPELGTALDRLAQAEGATLFMVLLAGLAAMLGQRSGQTDFCIGTPVAGRTRVEMEHVVGLFANTLPLRADLSGNPTFRELLARTRTTAIEALTRQQVPFGRIVAELNLARDLSRTQVFQVIFVLHTELAGARTAPAGLRIEDFPVAGPQIIHDLVIHVWATASGMQVEVRYDSALWRPETVQAMARQYRDILAGAPTNPDARLFELGFGGFSAEAFA
jgi:hypothetical protein